ncbi:MAG: PD40 domain-containing protein [Chloroflexi bacterium]|nr:PD40 domain-containing protein [Chloroflexota bacterium]
MHRDSRRAASPPPSAPPAAKVAFTTVPTSTSVPTRPNASPLSQTTDTPTSTSTSTNTPAPTPTPTRPSAQLSQLMDGGCCVSPFWAPDSQSVLFIDKPTATAPAGIYRVRLERPRQSELWTERIAFYTRELDYAQIPAQAGTRLIRVSDGQEVRIKNGGRTVQISPDRTRIVWTETRETFPIENRVSTIMLAKIDGSEPQRVLQTLRGGVSGWLDDNRLLVSGRASRDTTASTLFVYDLRDESQTEIVRAERLRLTAPSRGGTWIGYTLTSDPDPARNGLWVARSDGTDARKLDFFGPLQWRDDARFIYVPFEMDAPMHAFYEYDVTTGETRRLTPPDQTFKIASGDWTVSPDGSKIVFVNAADNNLWLRQLE